MHEVDCPFPKLTTHPYVHNTRSLASPFLDLIPTGVLFYFTKELIALL